MYYLITTQILKKGTPAQSILAYDSLDNAESAFHSTNGSAYISTAIEVCSAQVVDDVGSVVNNLKKYIGNTEVNDKFFVVSIQEEENAHPCSISAYNNANEALSAMEMTASSNCVSQSLKSWACFVINKIGGRLDEYSDRKPEPEPNEE